MRENKKVFLEASEALDYGKVLEMMDACRRAGAVEMTWVTRDPTRAS
jgi:biopolymer transport protein ExbD